MGPTLPHDMVFHCGTLLNETHGIFTGGYFETKTLIVDLENVQSMTFGPEHYGPELSNNERHYTCGSFQHQNGTKYESANGKKPRYILKREVIMKLLVIIVSKFP